MAAKVRFDPECDSREHAQAPPARSTYTAKAFERAAAMFRGAGDARRLRVLERLLTGEMCVTDVAASVEDTLASTSQRLRILRSEGLVRARRDGKQVFYALADAHVFRMVQDVLTHAIEPIVPDDEP
jgi:DNA-binding transcriptional ArsR family regulator